MPFIPSLQINQIYLEFFRKIPTVPEASREIVLVQIGSVVTLVTSDLLPLSFPGIVLQMGAKCDPVKIAARREHDYF